MISLCRIQNCAILRRPLTGLIKKLNFSSTEPALDVNTNVVKDVILFKYDNPRFFKMINIFAACQFLFWSYVSVISFKTLRDTPVESTETTWWKKINLGESKYRYTFAIVSFFIGYGILAVTWMYTLKSVRFLILRKGGKQITLVTYSPLGHNRMITATLNNITCKQSRTAATSQLPIKLRGQYLHYILDMRGEFRNPVLFDQTAGLARKWRTID